MNRKKRGRVKVTHQPHKLKTEGSTPSPATVLTDLEEFQQIYGGEWLRIVQSAPFRAGLLFLNIRKLEAITTLSNRDIETSGREILSDLRGHMILENDLMRLHVMQESVLPTEEPEEYFSPTQLAELEMIKERFREETKKTRHHA